MPETRKKNRFYEDSPDSLIWTVTTRTEKEQEEDRKYTEKFIKGLEEEV